MNTPATDAFLRDLQVLLERLEEPCPLRMEWLSVAVMAEQVTILTAAVNRLTDSIAAHNQWKAQP